MSLGGGALERTRTGPDDNRDAGLARAAASNNRALRHARSVAWRPGLRGGIVGLLACTAAGCSLSFPIGGLKADATATGSVDHTAAVLSPALDREDLRRARAALAIALDPQGNGARVGWQNPQSGAHGAFAASAPPFADHDRVCRTFTGAVSAAAAAEQHVSGSACREGDGSWQVRGTGDGAKA